MVTRKSMFTRKPAVLGTKMEPLALPQAGDVVGMDFSGLWFPYMFEKEGVFYIMSPRSEAILWGFPHVRFNHSPQRKQIEVVVKRVGKELHQSSHLGMYWAFLLSLGVDASTRWRRVGQGEKTADLSSLGPAVTGWSLSQFWSQAGGDRSGRLCYPWKSEVTAGLGKWWLRGNTQRSISLVTLNWQWTLTIIDRCLVWETRTQVDK